MATYVIGDIQGCLEPLDRLLDAVAFSPGRDTLWIAGDLVNRGPDSLGVLRRIYELRAHCTVVLGNHDLHLLAYSIGARAAHRSDTLDDVLQAADADTLLNWLRHQPLFYYEPTSKRCLVHAGVHPSWNALKAQSLSREVERCLQSDDYQTFLQTMYGNKPAQWSDDLRGYERLRVITNYFTRVRFCRPNGSMDFEHKSTSAPEPYQPWFTLANRQTQSNTLFIGHWAALNGTTGQSNVQATDTGCVWGQCLTATELETLERIQVPCSQ